jgi:hypothetical protein
MVVGRHKPPRVARTTCCPRSRSDTRSRPGRPPVRSQDDTEADLRSGGTRPSRDIIRLPSSSAARPRPAQEGRARRPEFAAGPTAREVPRLRRHARPCPCPRPFPGPDQIRRFMKLRERGSSVHIERLSPGTLSSYAGAVDLSGAVW